MVKEIVVVAEYFTMGGAERVLSELISEWINMDFEVTAIQIRPGKFQNSYELPKQLKIVDFHASNNRFLRRIQNTIDLVKYLKKHSSATVVSFVEPAMLIVAMSSFWISNRIIFSERCDPKRNPPQKTKRLVRDAIFNIPDICVFQTRDAKEYYSKKIQEKGVIIPNPINPMLPDPFMGERRKAIVFVGRITKQKNIPMLLDAFEKIHMEYPEYVLEIYGQGDMENEVRTIISNKKLENSIILMGFAKDVCHKINDCTMYVSSSDYEGISNSMLEALAMGIPAVITDCPVGGAREMIKNEISGLLVPVEDSEKMYMAMKKVIDNPEFAKELSRNEILIRKKYPIEVIANEWIKII